MQRKRKKKYPERTVLVLCYSVMHICNSLLVDDIQESIHVYMYITFTFTLLPGKADRKLWGRDLRFSILLFGSLYETMTIIIKQLYGTLFHLHPAPIAVFLYFLSLRYGSTLSLRDNDQTIIKRYIPLPYRI